MFMKIDFSPIKLALGFLFFLLTGWMLVPQYSSRSPKPLGQCVLFIKTKCLLTIYIVLQYSPSETHIFCSSVRALIAKHIYFKRNINILHQLTKTIKFYKQIHSYRTHVMLVCSLILKNISFCNVLSMFCIKRLILHRFR